MSDDPNTRPGDPDPPELRLAVRAVLVLLDDAADRLRYRSDERDHDVILRISAMVAVFRRIRDRLDDEEGDTG